MLDDLSSVFTIVRLVLLFVGIGALAVWAARQPGQESILLKGLTERHGKRDGD
jgi:hypothetical protein